MSPPTPPKNAFGNYYFKYESCDNCKMTSEINHVHVNTINVIRAIHCIQVNTTEIKNNASNVTGIWSIVLKGKGEVVPVLSFNWAPRHEGVLGEWRYSSTYSLTSPLDGGEWSASRPGLFTSRERAPGTH
jgi:hypothetical protein